MQTLPLGRKVELWDTKRTNFYMKFLVFPSDLRRLLICLRSGEDGDALLQHLTYEEAIASPKRND